MATNTLAEFSDGEDDWVFEIDSDLWNDSEDDNIIQSINEDEVLNQTGLLSMNDLWNDSEDDNVIQSINEDEVLNQTGLLPMNDLWNDSEDDNVIQSINEDEVLNQMGPIEMDDLWNDSEDDDLIRSIDEDEVLNQTGRGEKRKSDDQGEKPQQNYYHIESVKKHHSKKFRMTATDHTVQFNNVLHDVDLLESHERTRSIFQHLIEDVTSGMNPND